MRWIFRDGSSFSILWFLKRVCNYFQHEICLKSLITHMLHFTNTEKYCVLTLKGRGWGQSSASVFFLTKKNKFSLLACPYQSFGYLVPPLWHMEMLHSGTNSMFSIIHTCLKTNKFTVNAYMFAKHSPFKSFCSELTSFSLDMTQFWEGPQEVPDMLPTDR